MTQSNVRIKKVKTPLRIHFEYSNLQILDIENRLASVFFSPFYFRKMEVINGKTPPQQQQVDKLSRSGSRTSSNPELESDLTELDLSGGNGTTTTNGVKLTNTLKKRISANNRTPLKAKRVKFYRNGDKFFSGITIPISNEKYRSYDSLAEDLTRILEGNLTLTGAIRCIYSIEGKKVCLHFSEGIEF